MKTDTQKLLDKALATMHPGTKYGLDSVARPWAAKNLKSLYDTLARVFLWWTLYRRALSAPHRSAVKS